MQITLAAIAAVVVAKPGYSVYNFGGAKSTGYGGYHGPAAPLAHDGTVVETPEVAHAKAAHLAAHAEAAAKASWGAPAEEEYHHYSGYGAEAHGYAEPAEFSNKFSHVGHGYHGPPAPLDHEGRVVDTPDVAHLKAAHLAAHAEAAAKAHYEEGYGFDGYSDGHGAGYGYHGPAAPLAHDGRVVDTAEVAHAKAAHLAAHSAAEYAHGPSYHHGYAHAPIYKW